MMLVVAGFLRISMPLLMDLLIGCIRFVFGFGFTFQLSSRSHKICLRHIFFSHSAVAVIYSLVMAYNYFGRLWFETVLLWRMAVCED